MRVCVSGGAGFIGSHVVRKLLERGDSVVVLDNLSTGTMENIPEEAERVIGSIVDRDVCKKAMHNVEAVFHLAANANVGASWSDPAETYRVNAYGTFNLLQAAAEAGVRKFVFSSTSSVYGYGEEINTESTPLLPTTPYGASKLVAETAVLYAGAYGDLATCALRYFNVYGPGQRVTGSYAAVVPAFIEAKLRGDPLVIHGNGTQMRDFVYVEDVVEANLRAAAALPRISGTALNVSRGVGPMITTVAAEVSRHFGDGALTAVTGPRREGDVPCSIGSTARLKDLLSWVPKTPFAEGIEKTVAAWKT